jgi:hypothetical protein
MAAGSLMPLFLSAILPRATRLSKARLLSGARMSKRLTMKAMTCVTSSLSFMPILPSERMAAERTMGSLSLNATLMRASLLAAEGNSPR